VIVFTAEAYGAEEGSRDGAFNMCEAGAGGRIVNAAYQATATGDVAKMAIGSKSNGRWGEGRRVVR
jgi:hypothetical protein